MWKNVGSLGSFGAPLGVLWESLESLGVLGSRQSAFGSEGGPLTPLGVPAMRPRHFPITSPNAKSGLFAMRVCVYVWLSVCVFGGVVVGVLVGCCCNVRVMRKLCVYV